MNALWEIPVYLALYLQFGICSPVSDSQMYGYDSNDIFATDSLIDFSFVEIVKKRGYYAEEHQVHSDGYKLKLHRINGSPSQPPHSGKRVVYVQHGFLMWTVNLVLRGPGEDLVFSLVDAGYDVWLGNVRGNSYSRSHEILTPEHPRFWDFSYHEIGLGDVKEFIDYALSFTNKRSLTLIGYSAGATEGLVLLSSKPEYNEKVDLFINIAPVAFWKNAGYSIKTLGITIGAAEIASKNIFYYFGVNSGEMFSRTGNLRSLDDLCGYKSVITHELCDILFKSMSPIENTGQLHKETTTLFMRTWPAGTSARSIYHLGQNIRSGQFQAYDFGYEQNLEKYNTTTSPSYQLSKISTPVVIFFGGLDSFAASEDIEILKKPLPNVVKSVKIDNFNHLDFVLADNLTHLLYRPVLDLIETYSHEHTDRMEEGLLSFYPEVVFVD